MHTLLESSINNIYYYLLEYAYICIRARTRVVCILARSSSSTSYSSSISTVLLVSSMDRSMQTLVHDVGARTSYYAYGYKYSRIMYFR